MKRVAITGAGGFVGGAAVRAFAARGDEVVALVRPGARAPQRARVVEGDLADAAALDRLVDGAGVVVHAAAWVHRATPTPHERAACFDVNVGGTRALLEAVARAGRSPSFVFVSTTSVYGLAMADAREDAPKRPENAYGESKLEAEGLVLEAARAGVVHGSIARPCAVYGPDARGNTRRLVAIVRRGLVPLVRGGANAKSFVHVDDLAAAIAALADAGARASGRVYNVAGEPITVRALCDAYARALGARVTYVPLPWPLVAFAGGLAGALARASGGRLPDLGRLVEVFAGEATVDASAIVRDFGVTFRPPAAGLEASLRAHAAP